MLEKIATGIVYRNPVPHLRAVHAWHPSLVRLDTGELLAAFDLGQGAESLDYRTHVSRSHDGGLTWSDPMPLFTDPISRRSTHSVRLSLLRDGTVVGFGGRYYRDNPEEGLVNRANLGYVPMDLLLCSSRDGGSTWHGPRTIEPSLIGPSFEICHRIIELSDGRWLAPTSTWRSWEGAAPHGMQAIALVSHDQGNSWPEYLRVMDDYANGTLHWEQSIAELPDRRLLAVAWAFPSQAAPACRPRLPSAMTVARFLIRDQQASMGQTAKLISLGDGRVLCVYRRHDRPGLWANLSRIDGDDWINLAEIPLWQGAASGMAGRDSAGAELSGLKFGFPSLVRLREGDVMVVFWCSEDCIHNIRWIRIHVEPLKNS